MSVAVAPGHPRTKPGTIRGPGRLFWSMGKRLEERRLRERKEGKPERFLPRAPVFCQGDFCPLSAALFPPVFDGVLPVSIPVSVCLSPALSLSCNLIGVYLSCLSAGPDLRFVERSERTKASFRIGFL